VAKRGLVIELDEVRSGILAAIERLEPRELSSSDALGLVLAADVVSTGPIPPFANTAMDGYAVRAYDTVGATNTPVRLRVVGELPAGHAPTIPVGNGEAIRIMTGAPMPDGADAIVMVELTERDGIDGVFVRHEAREGDHVRRAGGDVGPGEVVFRAGTLLGPAHLGVLASIDAMRLRSRIAATMSSGSSRPSSSSGCWMPSMPAAIETQPRCSSRYSSRRASKPSTSAWHSTTKLR
jgi:molybdopterin biosynthesis enzyme